MANEYQIGETEYATLTEDGVYEIGNADQLYWFAQKVNAGETSISAKLTANIVVNENVLNDDGTLNGTPARSWTPIGNDSYQYVGTFDGDNHTVSGLYFNDSSSSYIGLFGYVAKAGKVQNVGVKDSYFYGASYVGGVTGYNLGAVSNCHNTGTVSIDKVNAARADYLSGIAGYNNGTVENCYNTGTVSSIEGSYVGGIVGFNTGTVRNCYNTGTINGFGAGAWYVAGIVGRNNSTVTNCYNTGAVSSGGSFTGGVAGNNQGTMANCYFKSGTATKAIGTGTAEGATEKSAEKFASGEVAYLLNNGTSEGELVWFQTIGTDASPVFSGAVVYRNIDGDGTSTKYVYSNEKETSSEAEVSTGYKFLLYDIFDPVSARALLRQAGVSPGVPPISEPLLLSADGYTLQDKNG